MVGNHSSLSVRIGDSDVDPAEFLWKLLWERHNQRPSTERRPITALLVQALKGDEALAALAVTDNDVMARTTGLGAAVAALVLLDNDVAGGT